MQSDEENFLALAEYVHEEFSQGRGAFIEKSSGKGFYLIPHWIVKNNAKGLVIVGEGKGNFIYYGDKELNEFILVKAGFSLQNGREISNIVHALIKHFKWGSSNPETENVVLPQLTFNKGEKYD